MLTKKKQLLFNRANNYLPKKKKIKNKMAYINKLIMKKRNKNLTSPLTRRIQLYNYRVLNYSLKKSK